jgi:glyoxylase-like metal-dependent hydrolase (beta-lactamase superfamily II)
VIVILESFPVGIFQCNCVVLGDESSREAVVIDPGAEMERIREILDHHKLHLRATVHTHGHLDHVGAAGLLKEEYGASIHIHRADLHLWRTFREQAAMFGLTPPALPAPDILLEATDRIPIGSGSLEVIETPGHTPGSICLSLEEPAPGSSDPILFTGDTLFWKGIGRTDLWGGDTRKLLLSIRERIFPLPEETIVHPGHGPVTSIGDERRSNPFLPEILGVS